MRNILLLLFLLLKFNSYSQIQEFHKTDAFIDYIEKHNRAIGNISIFKNNKEIYQRKFGSFNQEDELYSYRIASVTKLITATIAFQLIEENKLTLETSLHDFFPEIENSKTIKIKHLLNHTSGLGDVNFKNDDPYWLCERVFSPNELLENIISQGISFEAGTEFSYSNSAYFLLGQIIEKITNLPYSILVDQRISKPLKLKYLRAGISDRIKVYPSLKYEEGNWILENEKFHENSLAFGDITASTEDLNVFINALFDGKLISKESLDLMKPQKNKSFGLGMMKTPFFDLSFLGHNGDIMGSHTFLGYSEKDQLSIAININGNRNSKSEFYVGILNSLFEKNIPYPTYVDEKILKDYAGIYFGEDFPFHIKIEEINGDLYGLGLDEGQMQFLLKPKTNHTFHFEHIEIQFDTISNEMNFYESGQLYPMKKIKKL